MKIKDFIRYAESMDNNLAERILRTERILRKVGSEVAHILPFNPPSLPSVWKENRKEYDDMINTIVDKYSFTK